MERKRYPVLCMLLVLAMLISGCSAPLFPDFPFAQQQPVSYASMHYDQPDMDELQSLLEECVKQSMRGSLHDLLNSIYAFYDAYDSFYTNYALADIRYCGNLSDPYWKQAFDYCSQNAPVADDALDTLYRILANSPLRLKLESEEYFGKDFFVAYEGENPMDAHYLDLLEQEAELVNRYYALSEEALTEEYYSEAYFSKYGTQMAQLFLELIALRQEIAAYLGYSDYAQYAYDVYYYREYTPAEAERYLQDVGQTFYDLYCDLGTADVWSSGYAPCGETETFQYVKDVSTSMGGDIADAFALLEESGLYDIAYSENKYDTSFETYLWTYHVPFIFMNSQLQQQDKLVFSHEFGHFLNDYYCGGSYAGTDVAEVHSQAFEYLSLCYAKDSGDLAKYKLADSLSVYMECAAYALFEQQVYRLTGDALTEENVEALYTQVGTQFGFDTWEWDTRDYVTISHFFTDPMYNISYVVSNDLAMQFYRMELETPGSGLALYEQCLLSEDSYLITFASDFGLDSPFTPGGLEKTAEVFRSALYE